MTENDTKPADDGPRFDALGLDPRILRAVEDEGYEVPTPIQAATIPPLLQGRDVLGQAQTGTGKTAAFALPLLSLVDPSNDATQMLVLAPTRELAMQVAEAARSYATHIDGLRVLPVYGGTGFGYQLKGLRQGAHVVVGTPGRVMDHMRRGSLNLDNLRALVLDEADEMLRMGFVDDVEWVLEQAPESRQIALFSATMPRAIQRIAENHLSDPITVRIDTQTTTADTVRQRYRVVPHYHKFEVLERVIETEPIDAAILFVRTRVASTELAERLRGKGHRCEALNGDVAQAQREKTVNRLKDGDIDLLVATDVAARGLDVERITHVFNYDVPHDSESYVHRIGRTGRAGREGEAILFVTPRERHVVRSIERSTGQKMETLSLPTTDEVNALRVESFKSKVAEATGDDAIGFHRDLVVELAREHDLGLVDVAAALCMLAQGDEPLILTEAPRWEQDAIRQRERNERNDRDDRSQGQRRDSRRDDRPDRGGPPQQGGGRGGNERTEWFRIEVGHRDGVRPGNIVGAIANEAGIEGRRIGHIDIQTNFSLVELPIGMPQDVFEDLQAVSVQGRQLRISRTDAPQNRGQRRNDRGHHKNKHRGGGSRGPTNRPKRPHRKGKK